MYIPNFNFLAQFGGELGEEYNFFDVKEPHIGLIFEYVIQLLIFCRFTQKGANFTFLTPQHPLLQIGA